jgi:alkylation response protein AidB-like acyl-CoA dehydrogenase
MSVLDVESLEMFLGSLRSAVRVHLPDRKLLELDRTDEFPEAIVRELFGKELGVQLLFLPEEYGGLGGNAFDIYRVSEEMARIDLGIATAVLATFLGSEPIAVGGTPEQKTGWLGRIATDQLLFAYGATEPSAGSDLGALQTVARRVEEDGRLIGYRITGAKQWISNGGFADAYTILANAPGGPSWFIVEKGAAGFTTGKPEEKHGIRASNTAALTLDEVPVGVDRLVGGVEGQGLLQAQAVFGYTRLMVAAFGLGGGWAALDRAIPYGQERIQGGGPLADKRGYTHKLMVPHIVRLEASRAFIEDTARRLDAGEPELNTEGAIAKYMATEAGNAAADASIQALGGYGYTHEYMVEKIKRDVRITTIYEGTSEIMEMTISRDRWQLHMKTRGQHYHAQARELEALGAREPRVGAAAAALATHALAETLERARVDRLTRHQHVLLRLGELVAWVECAGSLARRAAAAFAGTLDPKADQRLAPPVLAAASRVFARQTALKVAHDALAWIGGGGPEGGDAAALSVALGLPLIQRAQVGLLADMDAVADALCRRRQD